MYNVNDQNIKKNYVELIDAVKKVANENRIKNSKLNSSIEAKLKRLNSKTNVINHLQNIFNGNKIKQKELQYVNGNNSSIVKKNINYFSGERVVIYTCITGNYDTLIEPTFVPDNCDFYAVTDFEIPSTSIWSRINPKDFNLNNNWTSAEINRYFKMMPHILFPNYKYSVYIDGNIKLSTDATEFINRISPKYGMAFFKHADRASVYKEVTACVVFGKINKSVAEKWINFLKREGMPANYGLLQCSVIARDHSSSIMKDIMNEWWKLFLSTSTKRDQLIIPYILYKHGISVDSLCTLGGNVITYPGLETVGHK